MPELPSIFQRLAVLLSATMLVTGCVASGIPLSGERAKAEQTILQIVARQDPVIDPAPVANCVARNAKSEEVPSLAGGGDPALETMDLVLRRSTTQDCLTAAGSPDYFL